MKFSLLTSLVILPLACSTAFCAAATLRIGIVEYTVPAINRPIVDATVETLRQKLIDCNIEVIHFPREDLEEAVKAGKVDLFLSSSGFYRRLVNYGARDLATAVSDAYPDPNHSDGTAIIVRNEDGQLRDIASLKGSRLVINNRHGFSGYQIPMGEIIGKGFKGDKHFASIAEVGDADKVPLVLTWLKDHKADVAFAKQCVLEEYIRQHPEDARTFRVIEPKQAAGQCARSTNLYPTWTLGSTSAASPEISRRVTSAVLAMPAAADGLRWGVATDYSSVDRLLKNLKIGPYEHLQQWTVRGFVDRFWPIIAAVVLLLTGLVMHSIRVSVIVKERTKELRAALEQKEKLRITASETQKRLNALQKMGVINQISSIVAHELRQPIGAMSLYLAGLRTLVENGENDKNRLLQIIDEMNDQTARADAIVQKVRAYRKNSSGISGTVNLSTIVEKAVSDFRQTLSNSPVSINCEIRPGVLVQGDPLELELLTVNLVKNAVEALGLQEGGFVQVSVSMQNKHAALIVIDNGPIKSEADVEQLRTRLESTKENGMGLGLQIVNGIVERHRAALSFSVREDCGLIVRILFPAM